MAMEFARHHHEGAVRLGFRKEMEAIEDPVARDKFFRDMVTKFYENGKPIILNNLWGIAFGGGNTTNGATNELFVTVGQGIGPAELAGTFLRIVFKPQTQDQQ